MKKLFLVSLVIFFILFFHKGMVVLDPDFGWHVKMGQLLLHSGVPQHDPYSYTMPSFFFIDHEWLSDVLIAFLYPQIGMVGLSVLFATATVFPLLFLYLVCNKEERYFLVPWLILAGASILPFAGVRVQMFSVTFFVFPLIAVLKKKFLWFLPFIFLIWANLHGGFALGLVVLALGVVFAKGQRRPLFWITLISSLCTLINPYGIGLWKEAWITFTDPGLHRYINEWQPSVFTFDIPSFWVMMGISFPLLYLFGKTQKPLWLVLYCLLTLGALSSLRNIPLFCLFTSLLLTNMLIVFIQGQHSDVLRRCRIAYKYLTILILVICIGQLAYTVFEEYGLGLPSYPVQETAYVRTHLPSGNVFSLYNWGGYLIWQLPEKKVFIDGRMAVWHNQWAPKGESTYAFGDYRGVLEGTISVQTIIRQYDITTFLLPIPPKVPPHRALPWFIAWILPPDQSSYNISHELVHEGFHRVYQGKVAIVYERN